MKKAISVLIIIMMLVSLCSCSSSSWTCRSCGAVNNDAYCTACGTSKEIPTWQCTTCGKSNKDKAQFCGSCGTAKATPKDPIVEQALAFLQNVWQDRIYNYEASAADLVLFQIKNTRVIYLVEHSDLQIPSKLQGVKCIIEFELFTNFRSKNYVYRTTFGNVVYVMNDGTIQAKYLSTNPLDDYIISRYKTEMADLVDHITDYDSAYNVTKYLSPLDAPAEQ